MSAYNPLGFPFETQEGSQTTESPDQVIQNLFVQSRPGPNLMKPGREYEIIAGWLRSPFFNMRSYGHEKGIALYNQIHGDLSIHRAARELDPILTAGAWFHDPEMCPVKIEIVSPGEAHILRMLFFMGFGCVLEVLIYNPVCKEPEALDIRPDIIDISTAMKDPTSNIRPYLAHPLLVRDFHHAFAKRAILECGGYQQKTFKSTTPCVTLSYETSEEGWDPVRVRLSMIVDRLFYHF